VPFARLGRPESANPRPWDTCAAILIGMAALFLTACGGGANLLLPGDGDATHIKILEGNNQSGRVGERLNDPLVVEVTDSRGRPVNGASVAFESTSAGPEASIDPATTTTNAKGEATAQVVLGTTIGPQTGQASVVTQGAKPPSITFTVMALPENANGITAVSGQDQTGAAGSKLRQPLVVQVADAFGNPIPGVRIDWTAEGGGSVSDASNLTDESGRASVERTLGATAGPQTTLARSAGLAGSPVTFTHTATAGSASSLSIVSGNNQTATAGTRLPADLVVRLVDGEGNGVPGTAVAWVVSIGGGSVTPENGTTDDQGRASAQWTLGPNPGENRVDAVVSGVGIANFTATGTAGAPSGLAILTQPSGSAQNGVPFARQPVVQLRDGRGNDVATSGIVITAQLSGSGGELIGTRQRATDANGRASFTDLAISGATGRRTLVFTASGYAGATSTPVDVSAIATTTTITSDLPDPSVAGSTFTVEFRVTSSGPTPTGTVTVTVPDGTANCSGTLQNGAGSCQLTLGKVGARTLKATYVGGPGFNGSSDTESHQVTAAPPQNREPHADYNWHCDGLTCAFTDNSSDSDGKVVSWNWSFGDGGSSQNRNPAHTFPGTGSYQVTLTVTDNNGASDGSTANVEVSAPENKKPHAEFAVACPNPDLTCSFTDQSTDQDGRITGWHWDFGDLQGSTAQSPSHTYAAPGDYHVTLTVTDNGGASNSKEHGAHPTSPPPPPNQPPTAQGDPYTTSEDTPLTVNAPGVLANDTDPEGSALSAINPTNPSHGTLSLSSNGAFVYTPEANFNGADAFTYQAGDGSLQSGPATVTITVTPVNDPPVAQPDGGFSTTQDVPLVIASTQLLANDTDPDNDPLSIASVTPGAHGSVDLSGDHSSITYTPAPGFSGSDDFFTYTATDGTSNSNAATVTVTVNPAPPPSESARLGLRTQPPSQTVSGARLSIAPEVQVQDPTGKDLAINRVAIGANLVGSGSLSGQTTRRTDRGGRARFNDLSISAAPGSTVSLSFSASGYQGVTSQSIGVE
jgi:VCBS repeat-containing protein